MNRYLSLFLFCILAVFTTNSLQAEQSPKRKSDQQLITELGHASFRVRAQAKQHLLKRPEAIEALKKATKSKDAEIRDQAATILRKLTQRMCFSDREIVRLVAKAIYHNKDHLTRLKFANAFKKQIEKKGRKRLLAIESRISKIHEELPAVWKKHEVVLPEDPFAADPPVFVDKAGNEVTDKNLLTRLYKEAVPLVHERNRLISERLKIYQSLLQATGAKIIRTEREWMDFSPKQKSFNSFPVLEKYDLWGKVRFDYEGEPLWFKLSESTHLLASGDAKHTVTYIETKVGRGRLKTKMNTIFPKQRTLKSGLTIQCLLPNAHLASQLKGDFSTAFYYIGRVNAEVGAPRFQISPDYEDAGLAEVTQSLLGQILGSHYVDSENARFSLRRVRQLLSDSDRSADD